MEGLVAEDVAKEKEIAVSLSVLGAQVADLDGVVDELERRLEPILRSEPTAACEDGNKPQESSVPLVRHIQENTDIITRVNAKIRIILNTCEL